MGLALELSFAFRSWIGLAAALAAIGILFFRIHDEENLLHQEFGKTWEAYCQTSWRLLPRIY